MILRFGKGTVEFKLHTKGTVGIPYECQVAVSVVSESHTGSSAVWLDGVFVQAFLGELRALKTANTGRALLVSETPGEFEFELKSVDTLGHFVAKVTIGRMTLINSEECWDSTKVSYPFESAQLDRICVYLEDFFQAEVA